jgi:dolichol-phosphate mannosyltransferase
VGWCSFRYGKLPSVNTPSLSVILPTYNEADNIGRLIDAVEANVPGGWDYQILVVDDNSPDDTFGKVSRAYADNPRIVPILRTVDRGFAKSIRTGIEQAGGQRIIIMDSDLTHDPVEIPRLLHVGEVYDFVSGSRFCAGGRMVDTSHYLLSMAYNWLLRLLIRTQVQDNLGGYFTARRDMLLQLPLDEIFFGYGDYYFRLLHFVQKSGFSIVEVPAAYLLRSEGKSKSNWTRMLITYTVGAVRLKRRIRQLEL